MAAKGQAQILPRSAPPGLIRAFEPGIQVATLMDIEPDCLCTWVPRDGEFALKFANSCCPYTARHRVA